MKKQHTARPLFAGLALLLLACLCFGLHFYSLAPFIYDQLFAVHLYALPHLAYLTGFALMGLGIGALAAAGGFRAPEDGHWWLWLFFILWIGSLGYIGLFFNHSPLLSYKHLQPLLCSTAALGVPAGLWLWSRPSRRDTPPADPS